MSDIDVNVDGVTVTAPSGATIVYRNPSGLQVVTLLVHLQTLGWLTY